MVMQIINASNLRMREAFSVEYVISAQGNMRIPLALLLLFSVKYCSHSVVLYLNSQCTVRCCDVVY